MRATTTLTSLLGIPTRMLSSRTPVRQVWMQAPLAVLLSFLRVFHRCPRLLLELFRRHRHSSLRAGHLWTLLAVRPLFRLSHHQCGLRETMTMTSTTPSSTHRHLLQHLPSREVCLLRLKVSLLYHRAVRHRPCRQWPLRFPSISRLSHQTRTTSIRHRHPGSLMTDLHHRLPNLLLNSMHPRRCPRNEPRRHLHRTLRRRHPMLRRLRMPHHHRRWLPSRHKLSPRGDHL